MVASVGDLAGLMIEVMKHLAMALINAGCDKCIIPVPQSCLILIPINLSGLPSSWISKDPPMSSTIFSIDVLELAASNLSSMCHPAILMEFPWNLKKMVELASPAVKPSFSSPCFRVWCQMRPNCFNPYMLLYSLQTRCSSPLAVKPSG